MEKLVNFRKLVQLSVLKGNSKSEGCLCSLTLWRLSWRDATSPFSALSMSIGVEIWSREWKE